MPTQQMILDLTGTVYQTAEHLELWESFVQRSAAATHSDDHLPSRANQGGTTK
jgi:hypothetical protein